MRAIRGSNLLVMFLLELGVLVGVGLWGFTIRLTVMMVECVMGGRPSAEAEVRRLRTAGELAARMPL
ncbi:hypothetical protein [Nocardia sp. NPDC057440]|uniref:hypothetical protein n=1 Tax=Nocardia sp. NPDC057440 TaxID=3346134 RepID=UPI00366ECA62